jgi:hypothetical protein
MTDCGKLPTIRRPYPLDERAIVCHVNVINIDFGWVTQR